MHVVLVHVHVKTEAIESFKAISADNAKNSILEPGVLQFACLQQVEDPTLFTLLEVYRTPDDQLAHRETRHYQAWRDAVGDMQAEPRMGVKYVNTYPDEMHWK